MNRINLITLGVRDLKKARAFYRDGLGFVCTSNEHEPEIVFFNNNGTKLALYPLQLLAEDINSGMPPVPGKEFPGMTLAYNAKSKDEVDAVFAKVEGIGGSIVKSPQPTSWGGYGGYFRDLDGYYWEAAYGEMWRFDANDMLIME